MGIYEITLWQIFVILILFVVLLQWVNELAMNDTAHVERCQMYSKRITWEIEIWMVICVLLFTVFLYCSVYVYLFLFVTSARTAATK